MTVACGEKVLDLIKDELGGQIMKKLVGLRPKTSAYLKDNDNESKKAKGTRWYVTKKILSLNISKLPKDLSNYQ